MLLEATLRLSSLFLLNVRYPILFLEVVCKDEYLNVPTIALVL